MYSMTELLEHNIISLPTLNFKVKINLKIQSKATSSNCYINAGNDLEAIKNWLDAFIENKNTHRVYEKEAIRFLLWLVYEKGKPLSKLLREDYEEYFKFICNIPEAWSMQGRRYARNHSKWRPFSNSLSKELSKKTTIWAINAMVNYLVNAKYLSGNPIKLIKNNGSIQKLAKYKIQSRMLAKDEWQAVLDTISELPDLTDYDIEIKMRTQFLFAMLYFTGLRRDELVSNSWNSFRKINDNWWLFVIGKGNKQGSIPVNNELLEHIKIYRKYLGKTELPDELDEDLMFISKKTGCNIKASTLYNHVKEIGILAAKKFSNNKAKQQKLLNMSPHWIRHLSASHQDQLNIPARHIKDNHRHADIRTTFDHYVHSEDDERFVEIQKMSMPLKPTVLAGLSTFTAIIIELTFKKGGVAKDLAANKILQFIEDILFKNYSWSYTGLTKNEVLKAYQQEYAELNISYRVVLNEAEKIALIKNSISSQAKAWLFDCDIQITEQR